ncbi:MAG: hypothetical protein AAF713_18685 [Pseudomonadota bacterium]
MTRTPSIRKDWVVAAQAMLKLWLDMDHEQLTTLAGLRESRASQRRSSRARRG